MSHEVDVHRSDKPSSQRFPSSYHHVDQPATIKDSLHHLLSVLICQVDVINLQQPVVHSGSTKKMNDWTFNKLLVQRKKYEMSSQGDSYLNRPSAILPLSTLVTNIPQSPGKYGSFTPSAISNPSAFKSMSSFKREK